MVTPVVNHLSINSLETSLSETRDAVSSLGGRPPKLASCSGGRSLAMRNPIGAN
jgi:hypothetical protein